MANMADATGVSLMAAKISFTRSINYAATMIRDFHGDKYAPYKNLDNKKPGMPAHPGLIF